MHPERRIMANKTAKIFIDEGKERSKKDFLLEI